MCRFQRYEQVLALLWVLSSAPFAFGDVIVADATTGFQSTSINAAKGKNSFFAYSNETGVGTNVVTAYSQFPGLGLDPESPIPLATAPGGGNVNINVSHGLFGLGGTSSYGPSVGKGPVDKVLALTQRLMLRSTSGDFSGKAGQDAGTGFGPTIFANSEDNLSGKKTGSAAAVAFDPFEFLSLSPVAYDPIISGSLQLTVDSGGAAWFALDSSVFSDVPLFVEMGSPFDSTLWMLTVANNGPTTSSSSLEIDFRLNPLALAEITLPTSYILGLPGGSLSLTPSQLALLIEAEVESRVAGAFAFNDGTATLNEFSLFPQFTTFTPLSSNTLYANGVITDLEAVPEPSSLLMLSAGLASVLGCGSRRKWMSVVG